MDAAHLSFAQKLAHSTDKAARDETVATLTAWLSGEPRPQMK
jgi:hypothetical protein